tara:strand:- start:3356 stop:5104 length:1749 start_codon:yes stop_codon:yes gene_type:complete
MAYDKAIHNERDVDSVHVDSSAWRYNKNLLKSFIQVLDAMSTHLPRQITSGATHYFALDQGNGKVKVNPHISSRLPRDNDVIGELSQSDIKDYREAVKSVLENNNLWDDNYKLTMFNSIGFGSTGSKSPAQSTAINESLQAYACACRQAKGSKLEVGEFIDILNEEDDVKIISNKARQQTVIDSKYFNEFKDYVNMSDSGGDWAASSVYIANKIHSPYVSGGTYKFYRQDQYKEFKKTYTDMKNKIKKSPLKRDVAAVYGNIQMAEDKWNPADIIAVKTSYDGRKVYKPSGKSSLQADNSEMKNAVKLIDDFKDLYEYNKWIHKQFNDKNIIPISLKKTTDKNPKVEVVDIKEVKSLEAFLDMDVKVTNIDWKQDAQKCIINFDAPNFQGGFLDARGFEESGKLADIQIQLQQGKEASHGKVTLPVTYLITRLSKGTSYFNVLQSMRRKCFGQTFNRNFFDYKIIRDDLNTDSKLISNLPSYADYISKLSGGKHSKAKVIDQIQRMQRSRESLLTITKFIKNKVQSYEVGFLLGKNQVLRQEIKQNILKSMYLYASSKGFYIFRDAKVKSYMQSSAYIKVGG